MTAIAEPATDAPHETEEALEPQVQVDDDVDAHDPEAAAPPPADSPDVGAEEAPIDYTITRVAFTGVVAGLAAMTPVGATMMVAIAKTGDDELLVTIIPARGKDEKATSAIPLAVRGTAAEIDAELIDALASYVPARTIALASAESVARETTAAAKKAADDAKASRAKTAGKTAAAAAPKPVPPAKPEPTLCVAVTPDDATLLVIDEKNVEHVVVAHRKTTLPLGRYTITASKGGYKSTTRTVSISAGWSPDVAIVLEQELQSDLFGALA
jgi:PRTRC genetic system protein E